MKNIEMAWKEFNVDLPSVKAGVDLLVPGKCVGISANSVSLECRNLSRRNLTSYPYKVQLYCRRIR